MKAKRTAIKDSDGDTKSYDLEIVDPPKNKDLRLLDQPELVQEMVRAGIKVATKAVIFKHAWIDPANRAAYRKQLITDACELYADCEPLLKYIRRRAAGDKVYTKRLGELVSGHVFVSLSFWTLTKAS